MTALLDGCVYVIMIVVGRLLGLDSSCEETVSSENTDGDEDEDVDVDEEEEEECNAGDDMLITEDMMGDCGLSSVCVDHDDIANQNSDSNSNTSTTTTPTSLFGEDENVSFANDLLINLSLGKLNSSGRKDTLCRNVLLQNILNERVQERAEGVRCQSSVRKQEVQIMMVRQQRNMQQRNNNRSWDDREIMDVNDFMHHDQNYSPSGGMNDDDVEVEENEEQDDDMSGDDSLNNNCYYPPYLNDYGDASDSSSGSDDDDDNDDDYCNGVDNRSSFAIPAHDMFAPQDANHVDDYSADENDSADDDDDEGGNDDFNNVDHVDRGLDGVVEEANETSSSMNKSNPPVRIKLVLRNNNNSNNFKDDHSNASTSNHNDANAGVAISNNQCEDVLHSRKRPRDVGVDVTNSMSPQDQSSCRKRARLSEDHLEHHTQSSVC